jgi:hypothetical protein
MYTHVEFAEMLGKTIENLLCQVGIKNRVDYDD